MKILFLILSLLIIPMAQAQVVMIRPTPQQITLPEMKGYLAQMQQDSEVRLGKKYSFYIFAIRLCDDDAFSVLFHEAGTGKYLLIERSTSFSDPVEFARIKALFEEQFGDKFGPDWPKLINDPGSQNTYCR